MSVSTLTVALSTFNEHDVRAIEIGKTHPNFYHVYYMKGTDRTVMLVPRKCDNLEQLQREVGILLSRSKETQIEIGFKDGFRRTY